MGRSHTLYTCDVGAFGWGPLHVQCWCWLFSSSDPTWLRRAILLLRLRRYRGCQVRHCRASRTLNPSQTVLDANTMPYRQRYSHYLPLKRPQSGTGSRAPSLVKDGTKSPKEKEGRGARNSSVTQAGKRRSTMNSREAGYDEAEALRRAIEASKEDAAPEAVDGTTRRAKRGRSDSEEYVLKTVLCHDIHSYLRSS